LFGPTPASSQSQLGEVVPNPTNPAILGLKNLTEGTWSATLANGTRVQVAPGRRVRLAPNYKIDFGGVTGTIRLTAQGLALSLPGGRQMALETRHKLTTLDLPEVRLAVSALPTAEIRRSCADASALRLKNLSNQVWSALAPGNAEHQVGPGKSVKLVPGTKIMFGPVNGEVPPLPNWWH
jgi:hypothetical protein